MAGTIDTDPEALRAMARELKYAETAIDTCLKKVRSALNSSHWNDNVRRDFEVTLKTIDGLAKQMATASEESQHILNKKAQQLEAYLGR